MIDNAVPWREELLKVAERLRKRKTQKRWSERTAFLVERDIMVSAYAIRKLNEANKLSESLALQRLSVTRYELITHVPDMLDRHEIGKHYNLQVGTNVELSLTHLCNRFIHSWVWMLADLTGDGFDGVFVSSDYDRKRCLFFVSADLLIDLFSAVGDEDVTEIVIRRDTGRSLQVPRITARDLGGQAVPRQIQAWWRIGADRSTLPRPGGPGNQ